MIDTIKHKGLRTYWETGNAKGLRPDWTRRIDRLMASLEAATEADDLDLPGYKFHELQGSRKETYSVSINKNWRLTFKWGDHGAYDVDMEDYH